MDKKQNELFGKFQKQKVEALSAIKGGVVSQDTKTTLCQTQESVFDSDLSTVAENIDDRRCNPEY